MWNEGMGFREAEGGKTMSIPRFTAEASIGPTSQRYRTAYASFSGVGAVAAQAEYSGVEEMEKNGDTAEDLWDEEENGGEA